MKRPGRPPLDPADRTVPVNVALPAKYFDALCRQASREQITVPELIRRQLRVSRHRLRQPTE